MPDGAVHSCPLCGNTTLPDDRITVDLASNLALIEGKSLALAPRQAELLSLFVGPGNRLKTREAIYAKVWGMGADVSAGIVGVTICTLNKRLAPFNYRIKARMGRGSTGDYKLERLQ